jgi:hypothetical protein
MVDNAFPMVEIKERPILFSTEMVRAILDGRKTMTRRIVSAKNSFFGGLYGLKFSDLDFNSAKVDHLFAPVYLKVDLPAMETRHRIFPKYDVGDILWVRESAYFHKQEGRWYYKATDPLTDSIEYGYRWKPSIHVPKIASRIYLEITNIKAERVQDISPGDACDEGVNYWNVDADAFEAGELQADFQNYTWKDNRNYADYHFPTFANCIDSFRTLWQSINGEESWNKNPWVWVIEFKILSTTGRPK